MVSKELQTENALNAFRGGCPFRFQRSCRWRVLFQVSEELDEGCPFWFQSNCRRRIPFTFIYCCFLLSFNRKSDLSTCLHKNVKYRSHTPPGSS